tara:strand:+ start:159 stop:686 length:528 start_codon:yes stop_codon:yes gene_type:complete
MINKIIKMSNVLDKRGMHEEANSLDSLLSDIIELISPHVGSGGMGDNISEDEMRDDAGDSSTDDNSQVTFGDYTTENFDLCPGAVDVFSKLIDMDLEEDALDIAIAATKATDELLGIERVVLERDSASEDNMKEALVLARTIAHYAGILSTMLDLDLGPDFEFVDMHVEKIAEKI